jgi:hypothetical protein
MSDFDKGYICAITGIVNGHGESTETREALLANGIYSKKIAKERGATPYDLKVLNGLLKEIEQSTRRRCKK